MTCCYCGVNEASTKDHIPPKGIFNKPRPSNLITVPSCFECNNGQSKHDERFKIDLGMHISGFSNEGDMLFKKGVVPSLKHNNALRKNIIEASQDVTLVTKKTGISKKVTLVKWDSSAHDSVIARITRGLFYHHFQRPIGENFIVKPMWFKKAPDLMGEYEFTSKSIANGNFIYHFIKANDSDDSLWLFEFYQGHWSGASVYEI